MSLIGGALQLSRVEACNAFSFMHPSALLFVFTPSISVGIFASLLHFILEKSRNEEKRELTITLRELAALVTYLCSKHH